MARSTPFVQKLYDESFSLLVEARNYFAYSGFNDKTAHTPRERLLLNYQAMRLTSRMTQVMAWMLAQRAIDNGELTPQQACDGTYSLGAETVCIDASDHDDPRLPDGLRELLHRSHSMYMRVLRLDEAARTKLTDEREH